MDDFIFIRMVFFTCFFVTITLTLLIIELVSWIASKLKSYLQRKKEQIIEWAFMARSA